MWSKEQRQVVFDAGGCAASGHILVDARFGGIAFEFFAEALAEFAAPAIIERKLTRWQQADFRYRVQAALVVYIKGTDGLDLVIKEINPVW